jgi:glutamine synthetase adenylyltransferase
MVQVCLKIAAERTRTDPAGFCVLAMENWEGEELNYSSDIDLIFLWQEDSGRFLVVGTETDSRIDLIRPSPGSCIEWICGLRPWGNSGPLVATVEFSSRLFAKQGDAVGKAGDAQGSRHRRKLSPSARSS